MNIFHIFWIIQFKMSRFDVVLIWSNLRRLSAIYFMVTASYHYSMLYLSDTETHIIIVFGMYLFSETDKTLHVNIFSEFVVSNRIVSKKTVWSLRYK